jgi:RNA polymerase sigma factor (sigma-70 family)
LKGVETDILGSDRAAADAVVRALFEANYLALVRLAMRLVDDQNSAEDLVQDVFAALSRRPVRIDDPPAYLRRAVVNRSRSVLRRRGVARAFLRDHAGKHAGEPVAEPADGPALRDAARASMLAAIATLPRRQREVVVLHYYEDLPVAQIAALLRVSPGVVSSALHRAHSRLASITTEEHDAD